MPHSDATMAVMYHYVRPAEALDAQGVRGATPQQFESQIELLCRKLEPLDWPTWRKGLAGRSSLPRRGFLLTFDDGLAEHARTVAPILERRGLRGLFFVTGRALTERTLIDAHAIHLLLAKLGDQRLREELLNELDQTESGADAWRRVDEAAAVRRWHYEPRTRAMLKHFLMITLSAPKRHRLVSTLFDRHVGPAAEWADRWYLTGEDAVALQAAGHTVGAHGYTHEPFGGMMVEEQRADLMRVAHLLDERLGPVPKPLSFPYGSFDENTLSVCRQVGFSHAFTTQRAWITADCDPLRLPRVDTLDVDAELKACSSP